MVVSNSLRSSRTIICRISEQSLKSNPFQNWNQKSFTFCGQGQGIAFAILVLPFIISSVVKFTSGVLMSKWLKVDCVVHLLAQIHNLNLMKSDYFIDFSRQTCDWQLVISFMPKITMILVHFLGRHHFVKLSWSRSIIIYHRQII